MHLAILTNMLPTDELAAGSRRDIRGWRKNAGVPANGQTTPLGHLAEMPPCYEGFDFSAVVYARK
jgi:hypothetical protein